MENKQNQNNNKNINKSYLPLELLFEIINAANTSACINISDVIISDNTNKNITTVLKLKEYFIKFMSSSTIIYAIAGEKFKKMFKKFMIKMEDKKRIEELELENALLRTSLAAVVGIREQPVQDLRVFVKFIIENATYLEQLKGDFSSLSSTNATQRITHLLRTFYIKIYEVPDKSEARTEQMMASLLQFMLFQNSNIKFFAMGILEILMNGDKQFKKIFIDQSGLEAILRLISENQDLKLLQQILSTLVTLIIAEQTYAENFVHLDGINLMVTQFDNLQPSSDDLYHALLTLKLVSDIPPTLAYMDLDRAIHLAIRGTLPPPIPQTTKPGGCISGSAVDTFWRNIVNSLGFLRNVCALNEQAKIYFTQLDGGGTISRLVELGTQCFDLLFCSSSTSTPSTSTTNIAASSSTYNVEQIFCINAEIGSVEIGPERTQTLNTMLNDCLFLLALVNKEYDNKQNDEIIRSVSEKLAADERVMLLYQFILKLDETEFQRSVLTSLQRILNCGVSLPVESRGVRLAENLLKYFSNRNTQTHLKKIAVEVLIGLVCEQSGLHLAVITPLLREYYQLPELMDGVLDVDLCVAIMKLTKELTNEFYQRELNLEDLCLNIDNINWKYLKYLNCTSTNPGITEFCDLIFNLLPLQLEEEIENWLNNYKSLILINFLQNFPTWLNCSRLFAICLHFFSTNYRHPTVAAERQKERKRSNNKKTCIRMMLKVLFSSFNSKGALLFFTFSALLLTDSNTNHIRIRDGNAKMNSTDPIEESLGLNNSESSNETYYTDKNFTSRSLIPWDKLENREIWRDDDLATKFFIGMAVGAIVLVILVGLVVFYCVSKCKKRHKEKVIKNQANETQIETRGPLSFARSLVKKGRKTKRMGRRQLKTVGKVSNMSKIEIFGRKSRNSNSGSFGPKTAITLSAYEKLSKSLREGLPVPPGFKTETQPAMSLSAYEKLSNSLREGLPVPPGFKTDKKPAITLSAYEKLSKSLREGLPVPPEFNKDPKPAITLSAYEKLSKSLREGLPVPPGFREGKPSTSTAPPVKNQKTSVIQQQSKIQPPTKPSTAKLPQPMSDTKNKNNVQQVKNKLDVKINKKEIPKKDIKNVELPKQTSKNIKPKEVAKNTKKESKSSETTKTPKLDNKKVSQTSKNSKEEKKTVIETKDKPKTSKEDQKTTKVLKEDQKTNKTPIVEKKKVVNPKEDQKTSKTPKDNKMTTSTPKVEKKIVKISKDEQKVKTSKNDQKPTTSTPKEEQKKGKTLKDEQKSKTTSTPKKTNPKEDKKTVKTSKEEQKTTKTSKEENKANIPKEDLKATKTHKEDQKVVETPKEEKEFVNNSKEEEENNIKKEEKTTKLDDDEEENSTTSGSLSE